MLPTIFISAAALSLIGPTMARSAPTLPLTTGCGTDKPNPAASCAQSENARPVQWLAKDLTAFTGRKDYHADGDACSTQTWTAKDQYNNVVTIYGIANGASEYNICRIGYKAGWTCNCF